MEHAERHRGRAPVIALAIVQFYEKKVTHGKTSRVTTRSGTVHVEHGNKITAAHSSVCGDVVRLGKAHAGRERSRDAPHRGENEATWQPQQQPSDRRHCEMTSGDYRGSGDACLRSCASVAWQEVRDLGGGEDARGCVEREENSNDTGEPWGFHGKMTLAVLSGKDIQQERASRSCSTPRAVAGRRAVMSK